MKKTNAKSEEKENCANDFYKRYINLKKYLSFYDFKMLENLNIEVKNTKCSEFDLGIIKGKMNEYYDIKWIQFKTRTSIEEERLEDFEFEREVLEESIKDGYITHIEEIKSLDGTGVTREQFEKAFEKIERLKKATRIYRRLRLVKEELAKKPTLSSTYRLLEIANICEVKEIL